MGERGVKEDQSQRKNVIGTNLNSPSFRNLKAERKYDSRVQWRRSLRIALVKRAIRNEDAK